MFAASYQRAGRCGRVFVRWSIPTFGDIHFWDGSGDYLWRRWFVSGWWWLRRRDTRSTLFFVYFLRLDPEQFFGLIWVKIDKFSLLGMLAFPIESMVQMIWRIVCNIIQIIFFNLVCYCRFFGSLIKPLKSLNRQSVFVIFIHICHLNRFFRLR